MTNRTHRFRINLTFEGDDNHVTHRGVERFVDGEWIPFILNNETGGFLIFLYGLSKCQTLYFRVNCAERALILATAYGEISIFSEDFHVRQVDVHLHGQLREGTPSADDLAWVRERMIVCPVSRNLGADVTKNCTVELHTA